jgi:hypothetical protein
VGCKARERNEMGVGLLPPGNGEHCWKSGRTTPCRPLPSFRIRRDNHRWSIQELRAGVVEGRDLIGEVIQLRLFRRHLGRPTGIQPFTSSALCDPVWYECQ